LSVPNKLESRRRVDPLPFSQCPDDVLHLPDFVFRTFARIDVRYMDDGLLRRVKDVQDVVDIGAAVEEVADVELFEVLVAVKLFVIGVGDAVEIWLRLAARAPLRRRP
jgi:hypothetical protein